MLFHLEKISRHVGFPSGYFLYDDDPCPRLNNHEIRKIDFSFVSEHCATSRTEKMKAALFEGGSLGIDR